MIQSELTSTSLSSKLYRYKPLNIGFIVLCANNNASIAKNTIRSLQHNYAKSPIAVVVSETMHKDDMEMLKKICPTYEGKDTITSLINVGMGQAPAEWNMLIFAGSYVRANIDKKFSLFVEKTTDILFPIAERKHNFVDGTMNGILVHRDTFKLIGDMADRNPLEICKMFWAQEAIAKGCRFKAIAGAKIC